MKTLLLTVFLLLMCGCTVEAPSNTDIVPEGDVKFIPLVFTEENNPHTLWKNVENEAERKRLVDLQYEYAELVDRSREALEKPGNWNNANRLIQDLIENNKDFIHLGMFEQIIAHEVLQDYLLAISEPDDQELEAIGFYADLLLKNNSPSGYVISRSLEKLEGYWEPARIRSAAEKTLIKAEVYLDGRKFSLELDKVTGEGENRLRSAEEIVYHQIHLSIEDLKGQFKNSQVTPNRKYD